MINGLSEEMLDEKTPPEVQITETPREPVQDPRLGIDVEVTAQGTPRHRLVVIGDSLSHGFQSGAIYNTDISYPAIIAHEMGWYDHFRHPSYFGQGGLPLNLEFLIRELEQEFGARLDWWELPLALFKARQFMARVEDWWDRGLGTDVANLKGINHNLAVYGWDLRDTLELTADKLEEKLKEPKDHLFWQIVENANERAALRVLRAARGKDGQALTPLGAAAALGAEGTTESSNQEGDGIETLVVLLGANNALPSILSLEVVWSEEGFDDLETKKRFTVWNPAHFQTELNQVVDQVKEIRARHVIWGTVPHVTIAPITRGVGTKVRRGSRYFPYYTRPWIKDEDFDAKNDPHITEQEARAVDSAIDQYNDYITEAVGDARNEGRAWYLLDVAGILDRLAARRFIEDQLARPKWWTKYELPAELAALSPVPDSRFFESGPRGRTGGGLFSLDGVHPTTIGYGILAQELINVMQQHAGVKFYLGDGSTERTGPVTVDFRRLITRDTLISDPPRSLTSDVRLIGWIDQTLDGIISRILL
jgi:hypothetical protein